MLNFPTATTSGSVQLVSDGERRPPPPHQEFEGLCSGTLISRNIARCQVETKAAATTDWVLIAIVTYLVEPGFVYHAAGSGNPGSSGRRGCRLDANGVRPRVKLYVPLN